MATTQKLSEQVKRLTLQVQELEAALSQQQSKDEGDDPPPLINHTEPVYDAGTQGVSNTIGSLSIGVQGQAKYHGESAGSEVGRSSLFHCTDSAYRTLYSTYRNSFQ